MNSKNLDDLQSLSMHELFHLELEGQLDLIESVVVKVEKNALDEVLLNELMRAAHAIKGAARMIELDVVVTIAHWLEESFVALLNNKHLASDPLFAILWQMIDLLKNLKDIAEKDVAEWAETVKLIVEQYIATLSALLQQVPSRMLKPVTHQPQISGKPATSGQEHYIRIKKNILNTIIQAADDAVIEARRFETLASFFNRTRQKLYQLDNNLLDIYRHMQNSSLGRHYVEPIKHLGQMLGELKNDISDGIDRYNLHEYKLSLLTKTLQKNLLLTRTRPLAEALRDFPRMVRDASKKLGKSVDLSLTGVDVLVDRDMLDALVAPLEHIVLNAIDHGIESPKQRMAATKAEYGNISLHAKVVAGMLFINIQDDGQGIDLHQLKQTIALKGLQRLGELDELDDMQVLDYIFTPGFSTRSEASKFSGRGYGLDIVHEVIKSFGGTVHATTALGKGMTIQILLPLNRSLLKSLVVSAGGELYGLPVAKLIHVLKASRKEIHEESGTFYVIYHQTPVPLIHINQILEKLVCADAVKSYSIVLLDTDNGMLGMVVDQVIVEEELLLQQATKFISQLDLVNGVSVNEHGEVILLLDVQSLKTEFQKFKSMDMLDNNWFVDVQTDNRVLNILIADASLTAREVQAKLLRSHGHVVEFATDGEAALQKITDSGFDLLITDLDLPKLDAVSLLRHLRQSVAGNDLPVLIVSDHPLKKLKTIREQNSNVQILPKAMFSKTALLQKLDAIKSFLHNRQQLKR